MKAHSCGSGHAAILTVASAFFLEVLDATIMLMAIIPMANDLGASISGVTLSLATYLLALVLFLPLSGHLFNRFALAQQFLCGLAIFCLASLACAISQNIYLLCIARLVQGFGSALVVPAGRALILANTPKIAIPKTMAWLIAPALVAPIVAPYMANLLLNIGNWRLIFASIGLFAAGLIIACRITLYSLPAPETPRLQLDKHAYALWALSSSALFMMFMAASNNWLFCSVLAAGAMLYGSKRLCTRLHQHAKAQLFDLSLLNDPAFKFNIFSGSLFRISIYAFPTLLIIHLMKNSNYSPVSIGHCLLFIFAGNLVSKPVAARLLTGCRCLKRYFIYSALTTSVTLGLFLFPPLLNQLPALWLMCFLHGCARSFQFLGYSSTALRNVQQHRMHHANILISSVMQHNALIGQALPALLSAFFIPEHLPFFTIGMSTVTLASLLTVLGALRLPNSNRSHIDPMHFKSD
ncbi:MFS transporter [Pseudomonas fragi]|uniref:MFS transporter n=1 Tax=Pseudomonas fragi TaxID=296 RepID=UPI0028E1E0E1|nr:MFS transporter [Pseudomonas fragi]